MDEGWFSTARCSAHVIHEYCRDNRSFDPIPKFNEDKLPRGSTFYNYITNKVESLLPLRISNSSGLGVDFSLLRGGAAAGGGRGPSGRSGWRGAEAACDLAAISRLDEVRTADLKQSRDNLQPLESKLGLDMKE